MTALGVTLLGQRTRPGMVKSHAKVFSLDEDNKQTQLIQIMQELKESLDNYTTIMNQKTKEGGNTMKFEELLKKYGKTKEDANINYHHENPAYENYKNEGVDIQAHVNSLWESLKTENSTEPWIHVTSIAIIVAVISLAAYNTYIKKKRSGDYRLRDKMKQKNKQKETI